MNLYNHLYGCSDNMKNYISSIFKCSEIRFCFQLYLNTLLVNIIFFSFVSDIMFVMSSWFSSTTLFLSHSETLTTAKAVMIVGLFPYRSKAYESGPWDCWSHQWPIWYIDSSTHPSSGASFFSSLYHMLEPWKVCRKSLWLQPMLLSWHLCVE